MTLGSRLASLKSPFWLDDIHGLLSLRTSPITTTDAGHVLDCLAAALERGQAGKSSNWLAAGLVLVGKSFLTEVRRRGLLRASKYEFKAAAPLFAVSRVLDSCDSLELPPESIVYLRSASSLLRFAGEVDTARLHIIKKLKADRVHVLRGTLVALDLLFMKAAIASSASDYPDLEPYTLEDLADGVSYLFHLFATRVGLEGGSLAYCDAARVMDDYYLGLAKQAANIRLFMECEIEVDSLSYVCVFDSAANELRVEPGSGQLDKAIRLGYIQYEHQNRATSNQSQSIEGVAIRTAAEKTLVAVGDLGARLEKEPFRRFRFTVPATDEIKKMFASESLFKDEAAIVDWAASELALPFTELMRFEVAPGVSVSTLVRAQRTVNYARWFVVSFLLQHMESALGDVIRSMVPVYDQIALKNLMQLSLSPSEAEAFIDLVTWRRQNTGVFDIQYTPIVFSGVEHHIPMNILGASNLIRNGLFTTKTPVETKGRAGRREHVLVTALRDQGHQADALVEYELEDERGDYDVIARVDERVFIFEFKASMHPCNVFELRTTFEHVLKGAQQLTSGRKSLSNRGLRDRVSQRLGWEIGDVEQGQVTTCIVTANRMLTGYRHDGHAIRSYYELLNFVTSGSMRIGSLRVPLRPSGKLSSQALVDFIDGDSMHRHFFDAMDPFERVFDVFAGKLRRVSHRLSLEKLLGGFGFSLEDLEASWTRKEASSNAAPEEIEESFLER